MSALLGVMTFLLSPVPATADHNIAVVRVEAQRGVEPDLAQLLTDALAQAVRDTRAFQKVMTEDEMIAVVGSEQVAQLAQCDSTGCLAELTGGLGVRYLLRPSLGKLGSTYLLTLRLLDSQRAEVVATVTERFKAQEEDAVLDALPKAVGRLIKDAGIAGAPTKEKPAAGRSLQARCDDGEGTACTALGMTYATGDGAVRDLGRAAALFKLGCERRDLHACDSLGEAHWHGRGVPRDDVRAAQLFKQACDGGVLLGCKNLGNAYREARGVPKDVVRAGLLFKQACDGGEPRGCHNLGNLALKGEGVAKDEMRGTALHRQACEGGVLLGCNALAEAYAIGRGVAQDDVRAAALYRENCDRGDPVGCLGPAWAYGNGRGVPKDRPRAAA